MPDDQKLDELERQCNEVLANLREQYHKAAEPYYEQLARIAAIRSPMRHTITVEQAREMGLIS